MLVSTWRFRRNRGYVLIDTYSTQNFWYAVAVGALCRMLEIRYIPILHGGNLPGRLASDRGKCRKLFGGAWVNVAPSAYLQRAFSDAGFSVSRIPNPFDPEKFPFAPRESFAPNLLWVRSLAPLYNPMMALEALRLLAGKYPSATLCMVGPDRGIRAALEDFVRLHGLRVTFAGRLSQQEWAGLSRQYDIFLNTSRADNAPFSLLEAASLGLAVVSTDVGGIPHLFENRKHALLVAPDAQAMAEAIGALIENPAQATAIVAGARELSMRSHWPEVRAKWLEILR
jgi:glycosyltransferase involved in cell wall biosynthesis